LKKNTKRTKEEKQGICAGNHKRDDKKMQETIKGMIKGKKGFQVDNK
jgi:hypothetical protein